MDTEQAREKVVLAGKKLLESGLIARTWGNVSCRISDRQFVITPSGRSYESLSPGEIVAVILKMAVTAGKSSLLRKKICTLKSTSIEKM